MAEAAYESAMNEAVKRYAMEEHIQNMKDKAELEKYWKQQHRARGTTNPEFDLNDPARFKKDKPARIGDSDPRCGVSSLQMFEGEDLGRPQRVKQQEAALLAAQNVQIDEFNADKAAEAQDIREYEDFVAATTRIRKMNAVAKERERRANEMQLFQENKTNARIYRNKQNQIKAESDSLAQLETLLTLRNRRLAEDTSFTGKSELGANRFRTDHFKGFSHAHRQTFYAENARQMQEKQDILAAERAHEAGFAAHVKNVNDVARRQAYARHIKAREDEMRFRAERKFQERQHKSRERADQHRIMSQKVTDEFLGRFGHMQR